MPFREEDILPVDGRDLQKAQGWSSLHGLLQNTCRHLLEDGLPRIRGHPQLL
jgi:hypothetical protein